jgi:two-component system phosphate regulon sensor histidine kinase PhoR
MKRQFILIAVIMLSIALTGLMVIQGYWIRSAYKVNRANFVRTVNEASLEVILTLEKMDIARRLSQPGKLEVMSEPALEKVDSINQLLLREMRSITTRKDLEIFFNKFFITKELMEDRMFSLDESAYRTKVDIHTLDSMLDSEFQERNMHTEWVFAIYNPYNSELVMHGSDSYRDELIDPAQGFHFELFPDDMHSRPDFLLLYFPKERSYIIGQVWPLVAVSFFLIVVIILSFTYTLIIFYRQKRLSELKNDFINNMTHEFKTPVSTISLACEALNDKDIQKSEELYRSYINIISEENRRLGMMAERILQSARLEKKDLQLNKELTDIHDILSEVIRNIGIQIEIKDGQILTDFQARDGVIEADRMHIVNVVQNLLDNANLYTPVKPLITVATKDADGGIIFSVQDNGIGISKTDQKKIFEKLYRVPEGNIHNFKGFGLGLSYVKAVVDQHGGWVRLESELKKGTKFEVFLPRNHQK